MIKSITACLLLVSVLSCSRSNSIEDNVHPSDVECKKELNKARIEINSGKLTYCNYTGNIIYRPLRCAEEMESLLAKKNIAYVNEGSPCIVQENRNYHCYCELMQEKIEEKYGKKMIDSLLFIADSLHVLKKLDEIYYQGSLAGTWDKPALFPGDTHYNETNHAGLQKAFDEKIKYPKGYTFTKEDNINILSVTVDVDREGKAIIADSYISYYNIATKAGDYNKQYWKYIKGVAFHLIQDTRWKPATIKNVNVNSKSSIYIYLK
jgi:hypothetical protein